MLRAFVGIILLALVLRMLAGCTLNLTMPSAPMARPAPPPPPRPPVINPCGMVNCNSNTRSIV